MQPIQPPDSHHLSAALGWLGLGAVADAHAELAQVSEANRNHPATLEVRWTISAHEKDWRKALEIAQAELALAPDESSGWLHRAYALRRVNDGGLPQAWEALLPAADQFPDEPVIAYNLACYACQMQRLDEAREWLQRAIAAGKKDAIRQMALNDEDLKPLWPEIRKL
ncbi:MAG TPA: tetratricopeptide repeat protein [Candidatus Binatia bacterium]|nr:tetratricopeptide repeat protein [Candidatus Binatia bacterium]